MVHPESGDCTFAIDSSVGNCLIESVRGGHAPCLALARVLHFRGNNFHEFHICNQSDFSLGFREPFSDMIPLRSCLAQNPTADIELTITTTESLSQNWHWV